MEEEEEEKGKKVSSLVHEEQHLRWLRPQGRQKTWSEHTFRAMCSVLG